MLPSHILDATRHDIIPLLYSFPGFSSCFMTKVRWITIAQLNSECAERLCISDVHIDAHCSIEGSSLWACFDAYSSLQFLRYNSDHTPGKSPLLEVVYRDGRSNLFSLLYLLNDWIGVLYYFYLYGTFIWVACFPYWHHPSRIAGKYYHRADIPRESLHLFGSCRLRMF